MILDKETGMTDKDCWESLAYNLEDLGILKMRLENMTVCYGEGSADLKLFFLSLRQIACMMDQFWSDACFDVRRLRDVYRAGDMLEVPGILQTQGEPHSAA